MEPLQQQRLPVYRNLEPLFEDFTANLRRQVEVLVKERGQLESEQVRLKELLEEFKCK